VRDGRKITEEKQINIGSGEVRDSKVFLLAGWDDAQHLDEEQKKNMLANMLPAEIEARTKGMPSIGSGMVYPVLEELITCLPFEIPDHYARIIGMDFGWTDPTALVFSALDRDTGTLYITFEYSVSGKTPDSHLADLQSMRNASSLWWANVMGDPAGQASSQKDGECLFDIYKRKGLNLIQADNARSAGILTCLQMMLDGKLKIFKTCHKLLNEIRTYAYDEKGRIIGGNDHLLDAMRYMIGGLNYAHTKNWRDRWANHYNSTNDFGHWFGERYV
jgi:phage terminase large subunit